jgi:hypothetical protein
MIVTVMRAVASVMALSVVVIVHCAAGQLVFVTIYAGASGNVDVGEYTT